MNIIFLRQAYKFIKKSPPDLKEKIQKEINSILNDPFQAKPLKGRKKEFFLINLFFQKHNIELLIRYREI